MVRFGLAKFLLTQRDRSGMWTYVWEESWFHPAVHSGLILFGVSFHISFLIWGQAILNKQIQSRVPQSRCQRGQGTRKYRRCMWWFSTDCWPPALCGGALESPTGEWSDSALEKQKRVNTRPPLPGEGLFHLEALSIPSPQKPQVCRHKSSSWEGFTVHFRTL